MTAYYSFKVIIKKNYSNSLSFFYFFLFTTPIVSLSFFYLFFFFLSSPKTQIFFSLFVLSFVMVMSFVASYECGYDEFCGRLWVWW